MGFFRDIISVPVSWFYGMGISLRHTLFDWGVLKSEEFDIPIICVGNITVGGTGKTPMTEFLVQMLSENYNVAILSRGYKRKTKGFLLATPTTSFKRIGDEPKQLKLKFPTIPVAVCEKRSVGIKLLRQAHPEVNLIVLDDAFQHRYVEAWVNIVLMDYNCPVYEDRLLPAGRLRDTMGSLSRANMFVITKCPEVLSSLDCRMVLKNLNPFPYQSLFFTRFKSELAQPLFPELGGAPNLRRGQSVIAIAGIANPRGFLDYVELNFTIISKNIFPDHYTFKMKDIFKLEQTLKQSPEDTAIVMTEKDAVKLVGSKRISDDFKRRLYYISVGVEFVDEQQCDFLRILEQYVRENQKYNITHPV